MDEQNKKIYSKIVALLNKAGYTKKNLSSIKKDELKPFLREVYNEFKTLGNLVESSNVVWQKAIEEVLYETKTREDKKMQKKESNENTESIAESQEDKLNTEDYDDLIQPEFPNEYIDSIHSQKIIKLAEQLENERKMEFQLRSEYNKAIKNAELEYEEKKEKLKGMEEMEKEKIDAFKKERNDAIKQAKIQMKKNIKDNKCMKNDEFLLLLCLMRKKKEQMYENNPYIVDFSVTLDSVYQSKNYENVYNKSMELFKFEDFENDLSKYVD